MICDCREDSDILEYYKGDTFKRQVIISSNNEPVDVSLINKVEFLLLTTDAQQEETHELEYNTTLERWVIKTPTDNWALGTHLMRYKITFEDGTKETKNERTLIIKE